jgi:hypothetical protein
MANNEYLPDVGLGEIRDGIVSESTQRSYVPEAFHLMCWLRRYEPHVLTEEACRMFLEYEERAGMKVTDNATKVLGKNRDKFIVAMRGCETQPLINEELLTPDIYIDYARTLRKKKQPNQMIGKQAYGVKRAALFHLFRLHNGHGYSHAYCLRLTNLFKGLNRALVNRRRDRANPSVALVNNGIGTEDDLENRVPVIENQTQPLNIGRFCK